MKTVDAPTFSERVDRFVRWFFTVSPEAVIERRAVPKANTEARSAKESK